MNRDTINQLIAGAVLAVGMVVSGVTAVRLSVLAARHKLVYTTTTTEGQPPQVALGIAMGAFRGIFVNLLSMRAEEMKEAGRYHEAVELAKAITTLQPRFPKAWTFHAWNLAYNISVSTQTASERWRWVNDGVELLRDHALKANPNDLHIHKELAWIFEHKIQGVTDDSNIYYKKMLAKEWHTVLGPPPQYDPGVRDRKKAIEKYVAWLWPIATAPSTLEGLYATENGQGARDLVAALKGIGLPEEIGSYEFLTRYEKDRAAAQSSRRKAFEASFGPINKAFHAVVEDPKFAAAWPPFLAHCRAHLLREHYNMDPAVMVRFTQKYGPLDWRNPAAHGLYWAAIGVEKAAPRVSEQNSKDYDFVNTDRVVIQCVQELYRTGTIYFDYLPTVVTGDGYYVADVEPSFAEVYGQILDEIRTRSKVDDLFQRGWSFYSAGYDNFLRDVVRYFYRRGDIALAEKYRHTLLTYDGQNLNDPDRNIDLARPLEEFVQKELVDRQSSPNVAISEVNSSLLGSFFALRLGDDERFKSQIEYAQRFFLYFREKQAKFNSVNPNDTRMDVLGDNFPDLAGITFARQLQLWPLDDARTAYMGAPDWLRQYAFNIMKQMYSENLAKEVALGGKKFEELFPEPAGMDAFLAAINERIRIKQQRVPNSINDLR